uniref:Uncharacterized protein n=1 Tax=Lactuca sativa TaxID=4236 RepID=A0A9R1VVY3_LACSA|nr:hypothetical protein LSAT_V11C400218880 [Lactuca sativa]
MRMPSSLSVGSRAVTRFNHHQRTHCNCGDPVGSFFSFFNLGLSMIRVRIANSFDWVDLVLPNQWYKEFALTIAQWIEQRRRTNGRSSIRSCSSSSIRSNRFYCDARCKRWCCCSARCMRWCFSRVAHDVFFFVCILS